MASRNISIKVKSINEITQVVTCELIVGDVITPFFMTKNSYKKLVSEKFIHEKKQTPQLNAKGDIATSGLYILSDTQIDTGHE